MVITMAKLCMAHSSTHGARKPPGPKVYSSEDLEVVDHTRKITDLTSLSLKIRSRISLLEGPAYFLNSSEPVFVIHKEAGRS